PPGEAGRDRRGRRRRRVAVEHRQPRGWGGGAGGRRRPLAPRSRGGGAGAGRGGRVCGGAAVMLAGKRILITGVVTRDSIAFHVAQRAQEAGAEVLLTGFGRAR